MYAFRIVLAEEQNLLIKERYSQGHQLSILFSSSATETFFFLILEKSAEKGLKNNYIIPNKTSINNDKNAYKRQVCNQQEIN